MVNCSERSMFDNLDRTLRNEYGDDIKAFEKARLKAYEEVFDSITECLNVPEKESIFDAALSALTGLKKKMLERGIKFASRKNDVDDPLYGVSANHFAKLSREYLESLSVKQFDKLGYYQVRHFVRAFSKSYDGDHPVAAEDNGWREFREIREALT